MNTDDLEPELSRAKRRAAEALIWLDMPTESREMLMINESLIDDPSLPRPFDPEDEETEAWTYAVQYKKGDIFASDLVFRTYAEAYNAAKWAKVMRKHGPKQLFGWHDRFGNPVFEEVPPPEIVNYYVLRTNREVNSHS